MRALPKPEQRHLKYYVFSGIIPLPSKSKMKNFILFLWYRYKDWEYDRKCIKHLGMKPTKIYLSQKDFDSLQELLNAPPDPKVMERFREILNRPSPWSDEK
jgi:hypothetical protein